MLLNKISKDTLVQCVLELNNFIKERDNLEIKSMTSKELKTLLYDWLSYEYDNQKMKEYIIHDINNYLYLLEEQKIQFSWTEMVDNKDYDAPFEKKKPLIHLETIYIKDFRICEKYLSVNESNKIEVQYQVRNPMGFNDDKLDSFYNKFMTLVHKESIFSKIKSVKEKMQ
ncbi:MAG: hypothetical protein PVG30_01980 [Gammaproteobacteria bacterium]|jgi:hypothetical protein